MRKKVFSLMALGLFMGSFMSMAPILEDDGRASDCARMARATVLALADAYDQDPNGVYFDYFLGIYNTLYLDCINN